MVDYREILRLQSLGYNITQIAGSLHSSRNTVREVERLADANVKHFFTLLGKMFFTPYGKEFFTYPGKQIFTS